MSLLYSSKTQKYLLTFLNIFGFFPFDLDTFCTSRKKFICCVFINVIILVTMLASTVLKLKSVFTRHKFLVYELCKLLQMLTNQFSFSMIFLSVLLSSNVKMIFLIELSELNASIFNSKIFLQISKIKFKTNRSEHQSIKFQMISSLVSQSICSFLYILYPFGKKMTAEVLIDHSIFTISYSLAGFYFSSILAYLAASSIIMHSFLLEIHKIIETTTMKRHRTRINFDMFHILFKLKKLLQKFSESFGTIFLAIYISIFATITVEIFIVIRLIASNVSHNKNIFDWEWITSLLMCICYTLPMLVSMHSFASTSTKIEKLYQKLMKILYDRQVSFSGELSFCEISTEEELQIHSNGYAIVDSTILFKVS